MLPRVSADAAQERTHLPPSPDADAALGAPQMRGRRQRAIVGSVAWVDPEYSRTAVRKAGAAYVAEHSSPEDRAEALAAINNWRSAHAFPLNSVQMVLRRRSRRVDSDVTVAQRLKRLPSIRQKLVYLPSMKLDRMQDIAGCRAVVADIPALQRLVESYDKGRSAHVLVRRDDYLWEKPKSSGYRGIHLVYAYRGDKKQYEDLKVEIQMRTRLQHAWATALETVDTFTRQALKSSRGDDEWLRFFALMSSEIAHREGTPIIPDTPEDPDELVREVKALAERLTVAERLRAYQATLKFTQEHAGRSRDRYFVLVLTPSTGELIVYPSLDITDATNFYNERELDNAEGDLGQDVVLVSVAATTTLQRAYPNYFLDTAAFVDLLMEVVGTTHASRN